MSQEEKDLILSNPQIFVDNLEYFDEEQLQVFSELYTVYHEGENEVISAAGTFTPGLNQMDFYSAIDFESTYPKVFTHEFCHSLQESFKGISAWLIEGLNAIMNYEYYDDEYAYLYQRKIAYGLSNLIGKECLANCSLKDGESVVKSALYEIIPNDDLIDRFFTYNNVIYDNIYAKNLTEQDVSYFETEIKNIMGQFYEVKYGKNIDDDLVMLYLLDYDSFLGKFKEQYNIDMDDEAFYFAFKSNYVDSIFNSNDLSNGYIGVTVPVEARMERYDYLTLERAAEEGVVEMHEDGTYTVKPTMYQQDENGMFYRQDLVVSDEVNVYMIDDTNIYLDNSMSR